MTSYYFNSDYTNTAGNAGYFSLVSGDSLLVDVNGHIGLTGGGSYPVFLQSNTFASIAGTVYGDYSGVVGSTGSHLVISSTGIVAGNQTAVHYVSSGNALISAGSILGDVLAEYGYLSMQNSGLVAGTIDLGDGGNTITNTGTISNTYECIALDESTHPSSSLFQNSGTIASSSGVAIDLVTGISDQTINNSGIISGNGYSIDMGSGDDSLTNTGTLLGSVFLGQGDDLFDNRHGTLQGFVNGGLGNDTLIGSDTGDDVLIGGAGQDIIDGGGGDDTASYVYAAAAVTVDMLDASKNSGEATGDTLISIERLSGSGYADALSGDDNANRIAGNGGDDVLAGRGGNDVLYGGAGNDTLDGGLGNDRLDGGVGSDTVTYISSTVGVTVSLAITGAQNTIGAGTDTLVSIENLTGSRLADHLTGDVNANTLSGGNGNDVLDGGLGNDTLVGGKDADTFVFSTALGATNVDTILDFVVADDTIDLARQVFSVFPGTGTISAAAFYIGTAAHDADDRIIYNSTTGALLYDFDGNGSGAAVQFATLHTHLALTNADFVVV